MKALISPWFGYLCRNEVLFDIIKATISYNDLTSIISQPFRFKRINKGLSNCQCFTTIEDATNVQYSAVAVAYSDLDQKMIKKN